MRYDILGPLRLTSATSSTYIGARKVETLLAALLIRAGHVVAGDRLQEEIWGGSPPRRATAATHVYVSQLRKILAPADGGASPIVTRPAGYVLNLGPDDRTDLHEFEARVRQGRREMTEGRCEAACASLKSALDMWRGPALAGVSGGSMIGAFISYLEDARAQCHEMLMEAQLTMGRHRELVAQLQTLINDNPLSEVFYRQLMLALYWSERRAEALMVYDRARRVLNEELGLEPGQPLRELHRAILLAEPDIELLGPRCSAPAHARSETGVRAAAGVGSRSGSGSGSGSDSGTGESGETSETRVNGDDVVSSLFSLAALDVRVDTVGASVN